MPYDVPADFFDRISQKTLQKAKNQPPKKGNFRRLVWGIAIAASLAGAMFIVLTVAEQEQSPEVVAQKAEQPAKDSLPQQMAEVKMPETPSAEMKKEPAPLAEVKERVTDPEDNESLNDVLASLTDEELLQMVAEIQSDPFWEETITE